VALRPYVSTMGRDTSLNLSRERIAFHVQQMHPDCDTVVDHLMPVGVLCENSDSGMVQMQFHP
jgi:hypothetical protein